MVDGDGQLDPTKVQRVAQMIGALNIGELLVLAVLLAQMNTGGVC
jgi:hypothetical protein